MHSEQPSFWNLGYMDVSPDGKWAVGNLQPYYLHNYDDELWPVYLLGDDGSYHRLPLSRPAVFASTLGLDVRRVEPQPVDEESASQEPDDGWTQVPETVLERYARFATTAREQWGDTVPVWAPSAVPPGFELITIDDSQGRMEATFGDGGAQITYTTQFNPELDDSSARTAWGGDGETAGITGDPGSSWWWVSWRSSESQQSLHESLLWAEGVDEATVREAALRMRRVDE